MYFRMYHISQRLLCAPLSSRVYHISQCLLCAPLSFRMFVPHHQCVQPMIAVRSLVLRDCRMYASQQPMFFVCAPLSFRTYHMSACCVHACTSSAHVACVKVIHATCIHLGGRGGTFTAGRQSKDGKRRIPSGTKICPCSCRCWEKPSETSCMGDVCFVGLGLCIAWVCGLHVICGAVSMRCSWLNSKLLCSRWCVYRSQKLIKMMGKVAGKSRDQPFYFSYVDAPRHRCAT